MRKLEKHKHMADTKQDASKQLMGQWRNQRGKQKISCDKWKWKQNIPNLMGCSKSHYRKEVSGDKSLQKEKKKRPHAVRYCYTPMIMAKIKAVTTNASEDTEKLAHPHIAGKSGKW